ncbi:MAG: hypothetical protein ABSB19_08185 [Methylomonas sp.]|jgi:hypothetical protein
MLILDARRKAISNIVSALDFDVFLPKRLFKGAWNNFLFFPSDHIFTEEFAEVVAELLNIENAHVCCFLNINETNSLVFENIAAIFLDKTITGREFDAALRGNGPSVGWIYRVDSYVCASDIGEWCIYCERENDIAVIGFRSDCGNRKFRLPMEKLLARPITELVTLEGASIFPFNKLTPDWRSELTKNFDN